MGELQWIMQFGQLSASAALVTTLGFLLYNIPKYLKEERASREKIAATHQKVVDSIMTESKEQARYEREGCDSRHRELMDTTERRHAEVLERLDKNFAISRETKHEVANLSQSQATRHAVEEARRRRLPPASGEVKTP